MVLGSVATHITPQLADEIERRGGSYHQPVWKIGHPISVRHALASKVSWGTTR
jgi:hypothetical protein